MLNLKSLRTKCGMGDKRTYPSEHPYAIFWSLAGVPVQILFGLLTVFAYSLMIISFLSIFLILYPYFNIWNSRA